MNEMQNPCVFCGKEVKPSRSGIMHASCCIPCYESKGINHSDQCLGIPTKAQIRQLEKKAAREVKQRERAEREAARKAALLNRKKPPTPVTVGPLIPCTCGRVTITSRGFCCDPCEDSEGNTHRESCLEQCGYCIRPMKGTGIYKSYCCKYCKNSSGIGHTEKCDRITEMRRRIQVQESNYEKRLIQKGQDPNQVIPIADAGEIVDKILSGDYPCTINKCARIREKETLYCCAACLKTNGRKHELRCHLAAERNA